jgi:hypothetical protein
VTPLFAEWIVSGNFLFESGYLTSRSTAVELGAGVSGILATTLGPRIGRYVATDQDYVLRLLRQNIAENLPVPTSKPNKKLNAKHRKGGASARLPQTRVEILELDWEADSVAGLSALLKDAHVGSEATDGSVDVVIACDCVYNDALIEPLNNTCALICSLRSKDHAIPTICLVAQQLRSPEVFEAWLKSFYRLFRVFRVPDNLLSDKLKGNSGFIVHIGILR